MCTLLYFNHYSLLIGTLKLRMMKVKDASHEGLFYLYQVSPPTHD